MRFCSNPECQGHAGGSDNACSFEVVANNDPLAVETLIAKLAMTMSGYMNDPEEDPDSPYLIVTCTPDGCSIIKLTPLENDLLQIAMRCKTVGDADVIHRNH